MFGFSLSFKKNGSTAFLLTLLSTCVLVLPSAFLFQNPPLIVINAKSESVLYYVNNPEIAAVPIIDARIVGAAPSCNSVEKETSPRLTGLLKPGQRTSVRYRLSSREYSIQLEGSRSSAGTLVLPDGTECELPLSITFAISRSEGEGAVQSLLPIAGPAEIGDNRMIPRQPKNSAYRRTFGLLYGGQIQIFGRTIFGDLYAVNKNPIQLPAGGKLSTTSTDGETHGAETDLGDWYGIALISNRGFEVSATTESSELRLHRVGDKRDTETFTISPFTRLTSDPVLAIPILFLLIFSIVIQGITGWMSLWKGKR